MPACRDGTRRLDFRCAANAQPISRRAIRPDMQNWNIAVTEFSKTPLLDTIRTPDDLRKLKIEQAAQRSIEKIMNTSASDTIENTLAAEAAAQANVSIDKVNVAYRLECDGVVTAAAECPEDQDTSQWISVTVTDKYEPLFTRHFGGINGDGTYHLSATAGVRIQ